MHTRWWVRAIAALGMLVVASALWHVLVLDAPLTADLHDVVAITMIGGAGVGLLYGGYWHAVRGLAPERYPRIAAWMAASTLLFVSVGIIVLYSGSQRVTPGELVEAAHIAGSVGPVAGLLVGTIHVLGIRNAEAAARAEAEAAALEAERERLEELDDLLRHYVLNGMQLVMGYSHQLRDAVPPEEHDALDIIEERADATATLIEHVRSASGIPEADGAIGAVDPEHALETAAERCGADVPIEIDVPDDLPSVRARDLTHGLALLCDALAMVVDADGRVTIEGGRRDGEVHLTVTAGPVAAPWSGDAPIFEPKGAAPSVKFYLAKLLVGNAGELSLLDRADGRLRFRIVLERAGGAE